MDFVSESESEEDLAVMTKELNLGKEGFLRTYMTLFEDSAVVEWFVISKTKMDLSVKIKWNLYNMEFEGDNIGTKDEPVVEKVVKPLQKIRVGRLQIVDVSESMDFKVDAKWC